jgi:hypothetical protein
MNRKQRRAQQSQQRKYVPFSKIVDVMLRDMDDITVMVGPILWNEAVGLDKRYLIYATSRKGERLRLRSTHLPP